MASSGIRSLLLARPFLLGQSFLLSLALLAGQPAGAAEEAIDLAAWQALTDNEPSTAIGKITERLQQGVADEEQRLALMLMKTEAAGTLGDQDDYRKNAEAGLAAVEQDKHPELHLRFTLHLADALSQQNQWPRAEELYEQSIKALSAIDNTRTHGTAYMMYGLSMYYHDDFDGALTMLSKAYEIFTPLNAPEVPTVLHNIALTYDATGDFDQAIAYFKQSLAYVDEQKEPARASVTYYNLGYVSGRKGDLDQGEHYLKKSMEMAERTGTIQGVAFANGQLGILEAKRGNYLLARDYSLKALAQAEQLNNLRLQRITIGNLLDVYIHLKDVQAVERLLPRAESMVTDNEHEALQRLAELKGQYAILKGDYKAATEQFQRVIELLKAGINTERVRITSELKGKFDTRVQEKENEILRQKNELQALTLKEQDSQRQQVLLITILLTGLSALLAFIGYRETRNKKKMAMLAMSDELTGAANRRQITMKAQQELERFRRYRTPVSFAMIDIDFFKKINDDFGHDIGDQVLKQFSKLAQQSLRALDQFGRFGGEEWLLVMPQSDVKDAHHIFERMALACKDIALPDPNRRVTFSMGVTAPTASEEELDAILKRADEALYEAKSCGRNQMKIHAASIETAIAV